MTRPASVTILCVTGGAREENSSKADGEANRQPPSSPDALKGQRLLPDRQDPFVDRLRRTEVRTAKIVGDITTCLR